MQDDTMLLHHPLFKQYRKVNECKQKYEVYLYPGRETNRGWVQRRATQNTHNVTSKI